MGFFWLRGRVWGVGLGSGAGLGVSRVESLEALRIGPRGLLMQRLAFREVERSSIAHTPKLHVEVAALFPVCSMHGEPYLPYTS